MPRRPPEDSLLGRLVRGPALIAILGGAALLVGSVAGRAGEPAPAASAAVDPPRTERADVAPPQEAQAGEPRSKALGLPHRGSLVNGVEFPREGPHFFTWDPFRKTSPNPRWRRYGTDRLVETVLTVLEEFAAANPGAPRVAVGDLSRPTGGPFYPTHRSHQSGLDVDVYYPRLDRQERPADRPSDVDHVLAQDLVDRFVAAGAEFVFVGPRSGLKGPPKIVQPLAHHDRHLHVRIPHR